MFSLRYNALRNTHTTIITEEGTLYCFTKFYKNVFSFVGLKIFEDFYFKPLLRCYNIVQTFLPLILIYRGFLFLVIRSVHNFTNNCLFLEFPVIRCYDLKQCCLLFIKHKKWRLKQIFALCLFLLKIWWKLSVKWL